MILKIGGKRKVLIKGERFSERTAKKKDRMVANCLMRYLLYAMYEGSKSKSLVAVLHYLGLEVVEEALRKMNIVLYFLNYDCLFKFHNP